MREKYDCGSNAGVQSGQQTICPRCASAVREKLCIPCIFSESSLLVHCRNSDTTRSSRCKSGIGVNHIRQYFGIAVGIHCESELFKKYKNISSANMNKAPANCHTPRYRELMQEELSDHKQ